MIDKQNWEKIIAELGTEIPEDDFVLVIKELHFVAHRDNEVILSVKSEFLKDRIVSLYLGTITQKIHAIDEHTPIITIKITHVPKKDKSAQGATHTSTKEKINKEVSVHAQLNQKYSFDNFIIGENNRYAANAALAIAKSPGTDYNPFLIYGGVGLGKTHLIQSVGNRVHSLYKKMKIIFVTAESFTNEFIRAIQSKKTTEFKNKYRYSDLLLIDDIHFLQKKQETQEEIFHTFNALYDIKKQMIFTCDRPVREIRDITDRLRNRFERGLTVDLQPPSYETRVAILYKKIEEFRHKKVTISSRVIDYIAENVSSNVRDLEAALTKLIGYTDLVNKDVTLDIAKAQLKDLIISNSENNTNISIEHIQKVIAEYFSITRSDLVGKKRTKTINFPRQLAIYIIRLLTNYSFTEIGLEFGGRDHSTIMYANEQIYKRLQIDPSFEKTINLMVDRIKTSWKL